MKKKINVIPYLFITPALLMLLFFIAYPIVSNLLMSFQNLSLISQERGYVGIKNYQTLIHDVRVWNAVKRTFIWTAINLVFALAIGLGSALLLSTRFSWSNLLNAFILIPWILPSVISGYIFALMFSENAGVITWMLKSLGVVAQDFSWFRNGGTSMAAAIIANVWRAFPFFTLMIYAKINSIPSDYLEAAYIEGASARQRFALITFPYITSVLLACTYLAFIWTFNAYDILKIMTNGGPAELTTTMSIMVQREAFSFFSLSTAATMSVMMFFLMFSIIVVVRSGYLLFKRVFV